MLPHFSKWQLFFVCSANWPPQCWLSGSPSLLILHNLPILQDKISGAEDRPNSKCKIIYLTGYRIKSFSDALLLPLEESTSSPKAETEQLKVKCQSWTRAVNSEWSSCYQLLSVASFTWFTCCCLTGDRCFQPWVTDVRGMPVKLGQQSYVIRVFTHVCLWYFSRSKGWKGPHVKAAWLIMLLTQRPPFKSHMFFNQNLLRYS